MQQTPILHNKHDFLCPFYEEIAASTSKLDRIIGNATPTSQPPGPELHHGQDLVAVLGHRVIGFLPAVILDEFVGVVDSLERARANGCQRRLRAREEKERRPNFPFPPALVACSAQGQW